jgi:hypothetical protein
LDFAIYSISASAARREQCLPLGIKQRYISVVWLRSVRFDSVQLNLFYFGGGGGLGLFLLRSAVIRLWLFLSALSLWWLFLSNLSLAFYRSFLRFSAVFSWFFLMKMRQMALFGSASSGSFQRESRRCYRTGSASPLVV